MMKKLAFYWVSRLSFGIKYLFYWVPRSSRGIKFYLISFIIIFCIHGWIRFLYTPLVTDKAGLKYLVRPGASIHIVIQDLSNRRILKNPFLFSLLVYYHGGAHFIKAGEYFFPEGTTPSRFLYQIKTGTGMLYHAFTIIPGWNFQMLRQALVKESELHHTIQSLSNTDIMKELGQPMLSPEGEFFPDTYYFIYDSSDMALLKRAFHLMQMKLNHAWADRDMTIPYTTSYQALIAASLIEEEAHIPEERPIISGVLINRLNKNMLLQFDPTVMYGIGLSPGEKIEKKDLLKETPYNTYLHKGLPPTPISMPSLDCIVAALHPAKHDYFYFVARGDGQHYFSKTLEEHNGYVTRIFSHDRRH